MSTNYSLLFYLKKPKNYVSGLKPIYMRITVDGIPKEVSTGRECYPSKWNSKANRVKGTTEAVKTLKSYLDTLVTKISTRCLSLRFTSIEKRTRLVFSLDLAIAVRIIVSDKPKSAGPGRVPGGHVLQIAI
ncbi:hypothetical protein H8B04_06340 [Sphingobacterium sp. DN04309]|uniref:Arm DNA-binding domain-containing protein n=2 Tax=Sphingobacterium litopenaei TaxID=2763500 RepID=A0ABR7YCZ8_9SPHI|nr:hypothetical protein [Sphingobacterium litopenaei]